MWLLQKKKVTQFECQGYITIDDTILVYWFMINLVPWSAWIGRGFVVHEH